ncbi:putative DNA-invertase from lambdoid prophage Rac [Andreesenia angusta]|uniref:Putative DNA-invertase from lambdoid prophage Rac n=1 Tax=Andreesenia angusta TaxID=39480 RepID=A0A1S1V3W6_9FIRM|nr:recombinase family protein [Andreesenia angusta]OHW61208.1 putative DNA-invertase from lambdoid prophage Rac [Andreesenia angusta]
MIYGYARVSTRGQASDGNSLDSQEKQLRENGAMEIIRESYTGTKKSRPELDKLLERLEEGDMLIVTKLDRIARSTLQGTELIKELLEKGVRVNILNMGILDNTPASKLIRTIFFAFAEFERDMIVERTQEGKAIAKQNPNFREGRPKKFTQTQLDHALSLLDNGHSYRQVEKDTRISKSTLIREVRRRRSEESLQ